MERRAPAKVNLALAVGGRRADGFHELVSVFVRLELADLLAVEVSATPGGIDRLSVSGVPGEAVFGLDLVLRAAALLREHAGRPLPALHFSLHKAIPIAAGLGGGSSDAAAALELAAAAWEISLSDVERLDLAARLGSDVPFFAAGVAAALVEGRGERLRSLQPPGGDAAVLLVTSAAGLATADVFRSLDAAAEPGSRGAAGARPVGSAADGAASTAHELAVALEAGLDADAFAGWAGRLRDANDLWPAAVRLRPELAALRATIESRLGRPFLLSGSGPTLVALYPSLGAAEAARRQLSGVRGVGGRRGARVTATTVGHGQHREAR
jgi:4-diphosphocytidyl-2-C-methyl-D-erythritol kinase